MHLCYKNKEAQTQSERKNKKTREPVRKRVMYHITHR